jgi:membrane protein YqaA with SNARE-associated domain
VATTQNMTYLVLFTSAFLSATVLPFASEVGLVAAVRVERAVVLPILVATAGNFLGACTTYFLGRAAAIAIDRRYTRHEFLAQRLVRRFGAPVLLLSWVPFVGDAIVALAGASRIPFVRFSIYTAVGKLVRYIVVGWAASL